MGAAAAPFRLPRPSTVNEEQSVTALSALPGPWLGCPSILVSSPIVVTPTTVAVAAPAVSAASLAPAASALVRSGSGVVPRVHPNRRPPLSVPWWFDWLPWRFARLPCRFVRLPWRFAGFPWRFARLPWWLAGLPRGLPRFSGGRARLGRSRTGGKTPFPRVACPTSAHQGGRVARPALRRHRDDDGPPPAAAAAAGGPSFAPAGGCEQLGRRSARPVGSPRVLRAARWVPRAAVGVLPRDQFQFR